MLALFLVLEVPPLSLKYVALSSLLSEILIEDNLSLRVLSQSFEIIGFIFLLIPEL